MVTLVREKALELQRLCVARDVRCLALFGSAAGDSFDSESSDLDFLVKFQPMPPPRHADCYFGLLEDLERLFERPVDLVEAAPIRNPYLLEAIEQTQVVVYEAA